MKQSTIILMKNFIFLAITITIIAGCGEKEGEIPLSEVPQVVLTAAQNAVEGIEFEEAEIEKTSDGMIYELEGIANGKIYEIEVSPEGKILAVEEEGNEDQDKDTEDDDTDDDDDEEDADEVKESTDL